MEINYNNLDPNVTVIGIPEIGVDGYYVWRLDDSEDENHFHQRAMCHAHELIRRHGTSEPYFIGYRKVPQDDRLHMVLRKVIGNNRIFEKILGVQDDFVEIT
jgi:hypothetical protein